MSNYRPEFAQDNLDVVIQKYGSVEYLFQFLTDNNLNINTPLDSSTEYLINDNVGEKVNKEFFKKNKRRVQNADDSELSRPYGDYNQDYNDDYNNIEITLP